jgi:hypothetical protein
MEILYHTRSVHRNVPDTLVLNFHVVKYKTNTTDHDGPTSSTAEYGLKFGRDHGIMTP